MTPSAVLTEYGGQGFAGFKDALAALTVEKLSPIGADTRRLLAEPGHIDRLLFEGAARAEAIANPIVAEVERIVGFLQRPQV